MSGPQLHMTRNDRLEHIEKIRHACKYIKDDKAIADYLGVPIDVVRMERSAIRVTVVTEDETPLSNAAERVWREAAQRSNVLMVRALIRYGFKHDSDLGMGPGAFFARADEFGVAA